MEKNLCLISKPENLEAVLPNPTHIWVLTSQFLFLTVVFWTASSRLGLFWVSIHPWFQSLLSNKTFNIWVPKTPFLLWSLKKPENWWLLLSYPEKCLNLNIYFLHSCTKYRLQMQILSLLFHLYQSLPSELPTALANSSCLWWLVFSWYQGPPLRDNLPGLSCHFCPFPSVLCGTLVTLKNI